MYLKRIEKVVETPSDNDIVVETNKEGDQRGSDAQATEPRVDDVPGS